MATPKQPTSKAVSTQPSQVIPTYGEAFTEPELLRYARQSITKAEGVWDPRWRARDQLYRLYAADSLDQASRDFLDETRRPPIDFPFVQGTIGTVWGSDMAEMKEAIFRGDDDPLSRILGDWLTRCNRWDLERCGILREESQMVFDLLISGYAFQQIYVDLTKYPVEVPSPHVEIWENLPDPDAVEPCLADRKFHCRRRTWELEEAQAKWPDKMTELKRLSDQVGGAQGSSYPSLAPSGTSTLWSTLRQTSRPGALTINDFSYVRFKTYVTFQDPETGAISKESADDFKERQKKMTLEHQQAMLEFQAQEDAAAGQWQQQAAQAQQMLMAPPPPPQPGQPPQEQTIEPITTYAHRCIRRAYIVLGAGTDGVVLEDKELDIEELPYPCITGLPKKHVLDGRVEYIGLMVAVRDAQLYVNRALSAILEAVGRGSKGHLFVEEDALVGSFESFQKSYSTPGMITLLKPGSIQQQKLYLVPAATLPGGIEKLLELAMEAIDNLSLVTAYLKGTATQERSQVLVNNLQTQNIRGLSPLLDPLTVFRMNSAKLRVQMMVKYLPTEQLDEIIGAVPRELQDALIGVLYQDPAAQQQPGMPPPAEDAPLQPIMKADGTAMTPGSILKTTNPFEFKVVVDVGQASPTSQQGVWNVLGQGIGEMLLNAFTSAGIDAAPLIKTLVRSLPLPGTQAVELAEEVEEGIDQAQQLKEFNGIIDAALAQGPEGTAQIVQALVQALQQPNAPGGQGAPGQPQTAASTHN